MFYNFDPQQWHFNFCWLILKCYPKFAIDNSALNLTNESVLVNKMSEDNKNQLGSNCQIDNFIPTMTTNDADKEDYVPSESNTTATMAFTEEKQ